MEPGVRIAVDWGKVRIGVAATDPTATLCVPVDTFDPSPAGLDRLFAAIAEREPVVVYMGLPRTLRGDEGPAAIAIREAADTVASRLAPVPLRLVDERLTTAVAHKALAEAGRSARRRRRVIDQAAAVAILEQAVELERRSGSLPGELVEGKAL
ncbi:Holliday junction resolvase RuvX [Propionicicella superfundia]|uniref:Holliday junction resolvase RuvX n=1 Tax=Propionicicella superfundia TaxID=348582 RepID=UPI0004213FAB|nr:Holliday junction resolvase RuvX [Propionicicella superfundia]